MLYIHLYTLPVKVNSCTYKFWNICYMCIHSLLVFSCCVHMYLYTITMIWCLYDNWSAVDFVKYFVKSSWIWSLITLVDWSELIVAILRLPCSLFVRPLSLVQRKTLTMLMVNNALFIVTHCLLFMFSPSIINLLLHIASFCVISTMAIEKGHQGNNHNRFSNVSPSLIGYVLSLDKISYLQLHIHRCNWSDVSVRIHTLNGCFNYKFQKFSFLTFIIFSIV